MNGRFGPLFTEALSYGDVLGIALLEYPTGRTG